MRVALVHERLTEIAGSENDVAELAKDTDLSKYVL